MVQKDSNLDYYKLHNGNNHHLQHNGSWHSTVTFTVILVLVISELMFNANSMG